MGTNLLAKIGRTWKGKQKKMMKSMKTKKGEVTNLHTDHHTKTDPLKKAATALAIIQAVEMDTTHHPKISIAAVTQIKENEIGTVVLVVNTASLQKRCDLGDNKKSYFSYITHIYSIC